MQHAEDDILTQLGRIRGLVHRCVDVLEVTLGDFTAGEIAQESRVVEHGSVDRTEDRGQQAFAVGRGSLVCQHDRDILGDQFGHEVDQISFQSFVAHGGPFVGDDGSDVFTGSLLQIGQLTIGQELGVFAVETFFFIGFHQTGDRFGQAVGDPLANRHDAGCQSLGAGLAGFFPGLGFVFAFAFCRRFDLGQLGVDRLDDFRFTRDSFITELKTDLLANNLIVNRSDHAFAQQLLDERGELAEFLRDRDDDLCVGQLDDLTQDLNLRRVRQVFENIDVSGLNRFQGSGFGLVDQGAS